jgi:hypothetical protein
MINQYHLSCQQAHMISPFFSSPYFLKITMAFVVVVSRFPVGQSFGQLLVDYSRLLQSKMELMDPDSGPAPVVKMMELADYRDIWTTFLEVTIKMI